MNKENVLFSQLVGVIVLCLGIHYVVYVLGAALLGMFGTAHIVLFQPMTDVDSYMQAFGSSWFGSFVFRVFQPIFGFYAADFIWFLFSVTIPTLCAIFFLSLVRILRINQGSQFIAAFVALIFIFYSRKIFNVMVLMGSPMLTSMDDVLHVLRLLLKPYGSWFSRFYQPGLGLLGLLAGLFCIHTILNKKYVGRIFIQGLLFLGIILSGFALTSYPWINMSYIAYLGILCLFSLWEIIKFYPKRFVFLAAVILFQVCVAFSFLGEMHPDYLERIGVRYERFVSPSILVSNYILLALCCLFIKRPLGKFMVSLQAANVLAVHTPLVLGYHVQPWHYFHFQIVVGALWLIEFFEFVRSKGILFRLNIRIAHFFTTMNIRRFATFCVVVSIISLYEEPIFHRPNYYRIPSEKVAQIKDLQNQCTSVSEGKKFVSDDPFLILSVPARTQCRSVIPNTWQNKRLTNSDIVSRYVGSLKVLGLIQNISDMEPRVDAMLTSWPSHKRELYRNIWDYNLNNRVNHLMLDYLFCSGMRRPSIFPQIKNLVLGTSVEKAEEQLLELSKEDRLLILRSAE
jgi:hypothetical protein